MRALTIIAGILLIFGGVWCLSHPGLAFASLAFLLGIVMLASGISSVINYIGTRKIQDVSGWMLADGILSVILSILMLANLLATEAVIAVFFGMWILFTGALRIMHALDLKKLRLKGWFWPLLLGILFTITGVYMFLNPIAAGLALVFMVGIIFLMQGVGTIITGVTMTGSRRY